MRLGKPSWILIQARSRLAPTPPLRSSRREGGSEGNREEDAKDDISGSSSAAEALATADDDIAIVRGCKSRFVGRRRWRRRRERVSRRDGGRERQ